MAPPWIVLRALPLDQAVRAGAAMGAAAMVLDRLNRPIAMKNLAIAFPDMDRSAHLRILRDSYRNFGRMAAEWTHFPKLSREKVIEMVGYSNREHWDAAIQASSGRGILTLTGHFGNFELLSAGHAAHNNRIALVARPIRNPLMDRAAVIKRLRMDWMVAIPLDLDTRTGIFVNFFTLPAATSPALARLAIATGAPVLPAFMVREGAAARHRITVLEPFILAGEGPRGEAARDDLVRIETQRYTAAIEQMVRRYPDHWNWIHRRWKSRPPGEKRFY
jgi:KDO2-lipid IV(A) lauroyltransferase